MRLVRTEIKKIIASYAILGFVALSLVFNALLITTNGKDRYADYVAGVSETIGIELGYDFSKTLMGLPQSEYRERLFNETSELKNVFADYFVGEIAKTYISTLNLSGKAAEDMRAKYADLQNIVAEKAEDGDSLSLYFAGSTYSQHKKLFGFVMPTLCVEGIIITLLSLLFTLGYENINRTEQLVYTSKVGRFIVLKKYVAAAIIGFLAYILLMALTFALYFRANDYSGVWDSNVSSGFNAIRDIAIGFRPFATWHNFTVLSYLLATVGLSFGLVFCFSFVGFITGTSIRNSYIAFLAIFFAGALFLALPMLLPSDSYARFGFMLTPIWLLLKQPLWFTDGGIDVLWRNFETWGVCLSFAALAVLAVAASIKFTKRDIV